MRADFRFRVPRLAAWRGRWAECISGFGSGQRRLQVITCRPVRRVLDGDLRIERLGQASSEPEETGGVNLPKVA